MDSAALLPAVSVALVDGARVLLVKRGRAPSKGFYAFPGGRVEAGETLAAAATRELMEETGLAAGPLSLLQVLDLAGEAGAPGFRLHVFTAPYEGGVAVAADDAEAVGWYGLADIAGLPVIPSVLNAMRKLLEAGSP